MKQNKAISGGSKRGRLRRSKREAYLKPSFGFAAPGAFIYSALLMLPICMAVLSSFTNWNGLALNFDKIKYVGLDNFARMFGDKTLKSSIGVTLFITAVVVVAVNVLGLLLALILKKSGRITNLIRAVFFIPYVLSSIAVSFLWIAILAYTGLINSFLISVGLDKYIFSFFESKWSSIGCICVVEIWRSLGFYMVIYLAALQSVPQELYEACTVDGGTRMQSFLHVTLPMIVPQITVAFLMSVINELRIYEVIYVLTGGGPGTSTQSITFSIIQQGFSNWRTGYASAIAVAMCLVIMVIAFISSRVSRKLEVEQ